MYEIENCKKNQQFVERKTKEEHRRERLHVVCRVVVDIKTEQKNKGWNFKVSQ